MGALIPSLPSNGQRQKRFSHLALFCPPALWQIGVVKTSVPATRGYFAIGVEGISKAVNLGNLLRSAHAFGASFVFTIGADERALELRSDTSKASTHLPVYHWRSLDELDLPKGCSLVGVEILDEARDLPSFPHPVRAAYVLGPGYGFRRPSPSMSPPPAPLSCMIVCACSDVSARVPWAKAPSRPRGPRMFKALRSSGESGLTARFSRRRIAPI